MEFDQNKPIYLQICDAICERILAGELKGEERIPSVREYGAQIGVNPNTVSRSYERLTEAGIIYTKRGMGFFVTESARENVLKDARETFMNDEVPAFLKKMELLEIKPEEIIK